MDATPVKTTNEINIPFPDAAGLHLKFAVGACRLRINPGAGEDWVQGAYDDPTDALPLSITQEGGTVQISQAPDWASFVGRWSRPPTFELALGKGKPYALTIETGASECRLDFGGLPLTRLEIRHGADDMELDFSALNPYLMSVFDLGAGADSTRARNLANANFAEMNVEGGVAGFVLDFGGVLQHDAQVRIQTGMAGVAIAIPRSTPAKITSETVLGGADVGEGFTKKEGALVNQAALEGNRPTLFIHASVTLGSWELQAT